MVGTSLFEVDQNQLPMTYRTPPRPTSSPIAKDPIQHFTVHAAVDNTG